MTPAETAKSQDVIQNLRLVPHPEGGWYREIHRSSSRVDSARGSRSALTAIYYLLQGHQVSRWHRVDADEIWHFCGGAPLELWTYEPRARDLTGRILGPSARAHEPVSVVSAGEWQAARSLGDYTLTACTVGPGFEFADFQFVSALPDHAPHFAGPLRSLRHLL